METGNVPKSILHTVTAFITSALGGTSMEIITASVIVQEAGILVPCKV